MSNYTKITDYAAKDLLLHLDPAKAGKGAEIGAEFDAIATMSATKTDKTTLAATGGAALVGNTPAGNIAATTVQAAINELDSEKAALAGSASQAFSSSNFTTAQGLQFPATQNPSADVNNLDDYEEGTWTIAISFGGGTTGITYSLQAGTYTKIGNRVFFNGFAVLSNKGSSTGAFLITGLPFSSNATSGYVNPLSVRCNNLAAGVTTQVIASVTVGASTITMESYAAGSITGLTDASVNNNSSIMVSGHYVV